jgi:hypothetical protein
VGLIHDPQALGRESGSQLLGDHIGDAHGLPYPGPGRGVNAVWPMRPDSGETDLSSLRVRLRRPHNEAS